MKRFRFHSTALDPRPVAFPPPHPYWITGAGEGFSTLVAYADNLDQLLEFWPEASAIDVADAPDGYVFTDRFQKPDWFDERTP